MSTSRLPNRGVALFDRRPQDMSRVIELLQLVDTVNYCCEQMKRQVEHSCDVHSDLNECPDSLFVRHSQRLG